MCLPKKKKKKKEKKINKFIELVLISSMKKIAVGPEFIVSIEPISDESCLVETVRASYRVCGSYEEIKSNVETAKL